MAVPTIADPPATTIDIDPGVAYTYVIPVENETSTGFVPHDDFTMSISGRVLTFTYAGALVREWDTINLEIFASNSDGTTEQNIPVRVVPAPRFSIASTSSSSTLTFGNNVATHLAVDDPIYLPSGNPLNVANGTYYVKTISAPNFTVSATVGGTALTAISATTFYIYPTTYDRACPVISSASTLSAVRGAAVNYTITADLSPDGYFARGLPDGLSISAAVISGNAPVAAGFYPIALQAYRDDLVLISLNDSGNVSDYDKVMSSRYLLLTVTS